MAAKLDATDWRILRTLMLDGRMTNVQLAQRVGITPPPCLRRVRALEDAGLIRGYHAELDHIALGYELTVFVMVSLHSHTESDLQAFENVVLAWPLVRESYMMSGEVDFLMKCIAPSMSVFQEFLISQLTATPNVASVKTAVSIKRTKLEPGLPIDANPVNDTS
ncbi:MAG: Lrp/AsnC family transcriptional regulator [Hyphomicrobiaceae bacterium]